MRESSFFERVSYVKSLEAVAILRLRGWNLKTPIYFKIIILIYLNQRSISTLLIIEFDIIFVDESNKIKDSWLLLQPVRSPSSGDSEAAPGFPFETM